MPSQTPPMTVYTEHPPVTREGGQVLVAMLQRKRHGHEWSTANQIRNRLKPAKPEQRAPTSTLGALARAGLVDDTGHFDYDAFRLTEQGQARAEAIEAALARLLEDIQPGAAPDPLS